MRAREVSRSRLGMTQVAGMAGAKVEVSEGMVLRVALAVVAVCEQVQAASTGLVHQSSTNCRQCGLCPLL